MGDEITVHAPAIRDADGLEVTVRMVVAPLTGQQVRRLRTEAADLDQTLSSRNPFVLPLLDHGVDSAKRPYLVTPRSDRSLADELSDTGPLPAASVTSAVLAAATGLELLHRGDHLHLDVTPGALLRQRNGQVVLDCPRLPLLAELAAAADLGEGHEPPEVLSGKDWSPAGEVYALASVMWTLLTGRPPFPTGRAERLLAFLNGEPPSAPPHHIGAARLATLRAALSQRPGDRPRTAAEFANGLREDRADVRAGTDAAATLPPPPDVRRLGSGYTLLSRLGEGHSAVVWRARRDSDGELVAAKVLREDMQNRADTLIRLNREALIMSEVRHPHLVRVHHVVADLGVTALVMDLVDGGDLRRLTNQGGLEPSDGLRMLAGVAEGLAELHRRHVVHRDVKPDNILVRAANGRRSALLTDFGLVRSPTSPVVTQAGFVMGSPAYLAPELTRPDPDPTPASDVYALGVTVYEVLAGRLPFTGKDVTDILRQQRDAAPPRLPVFSDPVWEFLAACLDKDPHRRPTASQAAETMAQLAGESVVAGISGADAATANRAQACTEVPPRTPVADPDPAATVVHQQDTTAIPPPEPLPWHQLPAAPAQGDGSAFDRSSSRTRPLLVLALAVAVVAAVGVWLGVWLGGSRDRGADGRSASTTTTTVRSQRSLAVTATREDDGSVVLHWSSEETERVSHYLVLRDDRFFKTVPTTDDSVRIGEADTGGCFRVVAVGDSLPEDQVAPEKTTCI